MKYIYLFPDSGAMGNYQSECRKFGLEFVGKNKFQGERNLVIRGSLRNLKEYAKYLGYELHPDYLYKENDFAGEIEDSIKDDDIEGIYECKNNEVIEVRYDDKYKNYRFTFQKGGSPIILPKEDGKKLLKQYQAVKYQDSCKDSKEYEYIDADKVNEAELKNLCKANNVELTKLSGEYRLHGELDDIEYVLDFIGIELNDSSCKDSNKAEEAAKYVAQKLKGECGPFGGKNPILKGASITLYSQAPDETYTFTEDGKVIFKGIKHDLNWLQDRSWFLEIDIDKLKSILINDSCKDACKDSKIYYVLNVNNRLLAYDDTLLPEWSEFVKCFPTPQKAEQYAKNLGLVNYKVSKYDYYNRKILDDNSKVEDATLEQEEKLHDILENSWTYKGKKSDEQVWQYTRPGYFPDKVKELRKIAPDLISYVDILDKTVYIKEPMKYDSFDDFYFGKEEYEKYGKLVKSKLRGKVISKKLSDFDNPGGLGYESKKLGISHSDLLKCLEGMCYNNEAVELAPGNSYKIKDVNTQKEQTKGLEKEYQTYDSIIKVIKQLKLKKDSKTKDAKIYKVGQIVHLNPKYGKTEDFEIVGFWKKQQLVNKDDVEFAQTFNGMYRGIQIKSKKDGQRYNINAYQLID